MTPPDMSRSMANIWLACYIRAVREYVIASQVYFAFILSYMLGQLFLRSPATLCHCLLLYGVSVGNLPFYISDIYPAQ